MSTSEVSVPNIDVFIKDEIEYSGISWLEAKIKWFELFAAEDVKQKKPSHMSWREYWKKM